MKCNWGFTQSWSSKHQQLYTHPTTNRYQTNRVPRHSWPNSLSIRLIVHDWATNEGLMEQKSFGRVSMQSPQRAWAEIIEESCSEKGAERELRGELQGEFRINSILSDADFWRDMPGSHYYSSKANISYYSKTTSSNISTTLKWGVT